MALTYGFYNSVNGDRKYDAAQFASIFDGLIIDGVFASIGEAFFVSAVAGLEVSVGIGKAWFNHTWTLNDSELVLTAPESELLLDRIDAVVLEVNASESVRANDIKFVKGVPASYPERPTLTNDTFVHQYPLCYIYRAATSTEIRQADITSTIGSEETPFVAAILKTLSLEDLLGQWQDDLDRWISKREYEFDQWFTEKKEELTIWRNELAAEQEAFRLWLDDLEVETSGWVTNAEDYFLDWFQTMKDQLNEDSAGNLQLQIDREVVERILLSGFVDGTKEFSDDGLVITSTNSEGQKLVKTFSPDFLTMTVVYSDVTRYEIARMVKTFSADGKLINTEFTYN